MNAVVENEVADVHADFSPSGFKRKKLCAGSHAAEKPYPNKSNPAAIDGTHTHKLIEVCLIHGKTKADEYLDQKLLDHEGYFIVDQARIDRANVALAYVKNQVVASAYPVEVLAEKRVNPGTLIFRDDWFGTGDISLICGEDTGDATDIKWINVVDYKDGAQPVDPFENYQGISYMLGVIAEIMPPMDTPMRFTIIQPKAGGSKEWDTSVEELMTKWLPDCEQVINNSLDPDAPRTPGDEQCNYCLHRLDCVERQGAAVGGINEAMGGIKLSGMTANMLITDEIGRENTVTGQIDFTEELPILTQHDPDDSLPVSAQVCIPTSLPVIRDMDNDTISRIKKLAPIVRGWLKDLDEEALERVKAGGKITGFKMVQKNGRRSWQEEQEKIVKALLAMTANKERIFRKADIVEEKLISFTKILGNSNLKPVQKQRIEKEFIKKPQGQKALVLETEKGKDISPAALLETADLPEITLQNSDK